MFLFVSVVEPGGICRLRIKIYCLTVLLSQVGSAG